MARHVDDQRNVRSAQAGQVGPAVELHATNGLVATDVQVGCIGPQGPCLGGRNVAEGPTVLAIQRLRGLGRGHHMHVPVATRLFQRLRRPMPRVQVIAFGVGGQQVHRDDGVLGRGAALHEENLVGVGQREQPAKIGEHLFMNAREQCAAMGHFHDRHPTAPPVHHLLGRPCQHRLWERGRAGREVVRAMAGHGLSHMGELRQDIG